MKRRAQPLERLVDAEPSWVGTGGPSITRADGSPVPERRGVVLSFQCPIHEDCYIGVPVDPPVDGGPAMPELMAGKAWKRTGDEDFATVTLAPSIRILGGEGECRWHGFIRSGRFETCGDSA